MRSDKTKKGVERAPHRSLFRAMGYTDEELERPIIGIVNSRNEIIPGHVHLQPIVEAVKAGVRMAGGTPMEFPAIGVCDGIAMGHEGMKYSLATRELIADSIECVATAHAFDALVMIPNCDKIVPGMLMAAGRLDLPTVVVSGGPMLAGKYGDKRLSLTNMFEAVGAVSAGRMKRCELDAMEERDGDLAWTVLLDPPDPRAVFRDIACGNGVTVAVGSDREGRIALTRSADQGIHWAAVGPALENTLQSVTYGNGLFVAVGGTGGQHGLIMTSPDGLAWTVRSDTYAYRLNHVRYAQGLFAIVGDAGTVLLSSDGIQWTRQWADGGAPVTGQPLYAVCEAQGRFLAVGRKGAIVQSDPVPMLPEPLIVVNGARGALTVGRSDPVTVAIALNAGSYAGVLPVDYIVLAVAEGGPWFYLDAARRWIPLGSRDPADCRPVHSGLLMDLPVPIVVLQARSLAPGVYDCYFVLDYPMNGLFDGIPRQYRYDRVRVVVQ